MSEKNRKEKYRELQETLYALASTDYKRERVVRLLNELSLFGMDSELEADFIETNDIDILINAAEVLQDYTDPNVECVEPSDEDSYWVYSVHPDDDWVGRAFRATLVCENHLKKAIQWCKRSGEPKIYIFQHGNLVSEEANDWEP